MDNKKLKSSWAAAFTVASVWFGTHVGAGFATGNQVVNYFVQYGWTAAIFPLLAMGILAVVMYIMMKFAKLNGFDNYKDTYRALYPKPWMEVFFEMRSSSRYFTSSSSSRRSRPALTAPAASSRA